MTRAEQISYLKGYKASLARDEDAEMVESIIAVLQETREGLEYAIADYLQTGNGYPRDLLVRSAVALRESK